MANPTQRYTPANTPEVYSDFDINLSRNPITGNLAKLTNEEAVKSSLRNLVLVMQGEWPHYKTLGSRVYRSLFQLPNAATANMIKTTIEQSLVNEPRAKVDSVVVNARSDGYGYDITITFYTISSTTLHTFSHFLKRIR